LGLSLEEQLLLSQRELAQATSLVISLKQDNLEKQNSIEEQKAALNSLTSSLPEAQTRKSSCECLLQNAQQAYEELRSSFHGLQEQDLEKQGTIKDLRADLEVLRQELDFVKNILDSNQTIHI
jgi:chromosome segregation ATPase